MARMRLLKDLFPYIKEMDPDTALTPNALRQMIVDGVIPHTPVGNRKLVNLDILDDYLAHPEKYEKPQEPGYGKIRKLS